MHTVSLHLPASLYEQIRQLAERDNISINQFITHATEAKLAALMTEEYLGEQAARGSRTRFEQAMSKVPNIEPDEHDRL